MLSAQRMRRPGEVVTLLIPIVTVCLALLAGCDGQDQASKTAAPSAGHRDATQAGHAVTNWEEWFVMGDVQKAPG